MTATRRIRALPGPVSRLPVIAMTANVLPEQVSAVELDGRRRPVGHLGGHRFLRQPPLDRRVELLRVGPVSRLPVIAMTANVLPEQVSAFRDAGMDDHVGKPFVAVIPSMPGICTSISTRSKTRSRTASTAACPSPTSPGPCRGFP
jgi:CheY-like chemotaxis protein